MPNIITTAHGNAVDALRKHCPDLAEDYDDLARRQTALLREANTLSQEARNSPGALSRTATDDEIFAYRNATDRSAGLYYQADVLAGQMLGLFTDIRAAGEAAGDVID